MNIVKDLNEYVKEVQGILSPWKTHLNTTLPWFRGHSDCDWQLTPNIYRNDIYLYERELIRDFKLNAGTFINYEPQNSFEWLFIMQHYGLPTRLLDWTEGYLIGLFFAVWDYDLKKDACVWILHPWSLNERNLNPLSKGIIERTVPEISHKSLDEYLLGESTDIGIKGTDIVDKSRNINAELPIAIRAIRKTERIIAQKGMFTIHGNKKESLDKLISEAKGDGFSDIQLEKIIIDKNSKKRILKQLSEAGITHSVIFPELEAISKELKFKYSYI